MRDVHKKPRFKRGFLYLDWVFYIWIKVQPTF